MNSAFDMPTVFPQSDTNFEKFITDIISDTSEQDLSDQKENCVDQNSNDVYGNKNYKNDARTFGGSSNLQAWLEPPKEGTGWDSPTNANTWGYASTNLLRPPPGLGLFPNAPEARANAVTVSLSQFLSWEANKEPEPAKTMWRDVAQMDPRLGPKHLDWRKKSWIQPTWPSKTLRKRFDSLLLHYLDPFTIQHNRYLRKNKTLPLFSLDFLAGLMRFRRTYEDFNLDTQVSMFKYACSKSDGRLRFIRPDKVEVTTPLELRSFAKIPTAPTNVVDFIDAKTEDQQPRPNHHFSVLSYSISSYLSQFQKTTSVERQQLTAWEHRRTMIRRQIAGYGTEIIALQGVQSTNRPWVTDVEVGKTHSELDHMRFLLSSMPNYGCGFNPVVSKNDSPWSLGCAIMWNKDVFYLSSINFTESGLVADLVFIETGAVIRVGSTRSVASYNLEWENNMAKDRLEDLSAPVMKNAGGNIVWCGDFGLNADEVTMGNAILDVCDDMKWTTFSKKTPSTDRIFYHGELEVVACLRGHSENFRDFLDSSEGPRFFPSNHLPQLAVFKSV